MNPQMFNSFFDGTKSAIEALGDCRSLAGSIVPKDGLVVSALRGVMICRMCCAPRPARAGIWRANGIVERVVSSPGNATGGACSRSLRLGAV